ncbi:MAG: helix-turn-helix transcriptional regulator [Bacteroidales bacterium]|nr:helix-turn-helix transcriptional regulator [Bacteroidales bacterium]
MKKVNVVIGRVNEGEYVYSVVMEAPEVPFGLNGTGRTVEEAKKDFLDAYKDIVELMAEEGRQYDELEFNYHYDIPSFLEYYAYALSLASLERISGINQRQLSHYINGTSKPRKSTVERFRKNLKAFAEDLQSVDLIWR